MELLTHPGTTPQNSHDSAEVVCLMLQDRMMTKGMHGLFPERCDLEGIDTLLDIGCGPGGWALGVSQTYPDRRVIGIDINPTMIVHAQAEAIAQRLGNVSFAVMDALQPLTFAADMFDLVNIRLCTGYVQRTDWVPFLQNGLEVLRPGGILRVTEGECVTSTTSSGVSKMDAWAARLLHARGYGFSRDGSGIGIASMLGLLLQRAGCVDIEFHPSLLDCAYGRALYDDQRQNYMIWPLLIKSALIEHGITTASEFDQVYHRMCAEMQELSFCGQWRLLTVTGEKWR